MSVDPSNARSTAIVVGGGISGLFAAYRLARRGIHPIVVERGPGPGGLLSWIRVGATDLELFYHHLFTNDRLVLDTLRALDVPIDWRITRTGFVDRGRDRIAEFSGPQDVLTFDYLSIADRARLLATLARVTLEWARQRDVAALDDIPARDWMASLGGARVYDRFFGPLSRKKWGSETPNASAAWLIGRLGMRAGRTPRGEKLGYPRGGFRSLVFGLSEALRQAGGELLLDTEVSDLLRDERGRLRGVRVRPGGGGESRELSADAVVLTPQPRALTPLLDGAGLAEEAARMERLPYQGALTVLLGLERSLSDFYWLNVMDPSVPFGAIIEHTRFQPQALYEGPTLYLASYPDPDDPLWNTSDEEVVRRYAADLADLVPSARNNPIRWSYVARTDEASLIYRCGVARLLPPRRAPVGGLYYTGMFRAYPKRPINLVAGDACACADTIAADLTGAPAPADDWLPETLEP